MLDSQKFLTAQAPVIDEVLAELRVGRKRTHWMWFIFPQLRALGRSTTARHFGLSSLQDAREWLAHPVLGPRLLDCSRAVLLHPGMPIRSIMGTPDDLKLRSCMTLFQQADPAQQLFSQVLTVFYGGKPDALTLELLRAESGVERSSPTGDR